MNVKHSCVCDIEYIQIQKHQCTRKMAIVDVRSGYSEVYEFIPCKPFTQLTDKDKRTFKWCQKHIHHLSYMPRIKQNVLTQCDRDLDMLNLFMQKFQ